MNHTTLINILKSSYIKNDLGECRALYFELCAKVGLHGNLKPEEYKWPWIYESGLGLLQHAPEKKYTREKSRLTLSDLLNLERVLDVAA
ncbi:hypothetical protein P7F88_12600 [Vibrio hannami]|uniref:hypothetical protein n=1 Tax=Vibrio hannami TaxID=2717094 RepID=UPI0024102D60|nr:hypothetical protein [Vibrio hannami]MDG3086883.1 hypothetical protein [Vibrio hannami]